jgi:hypothetical protein
MSRRVSTLFQQIWPQTPEFDVIAQSWPEDVVIEMLTLVWCGFDEMKANHLSAVDFTQTIHQLERGLTDLHAREITLLWKAKASGFGSFLPKPEAWEFASCSSPSAMPPSYDIGFEHVSDPRLRWPVEAKVLATSSDVGRYLSDLTEKYLSGKGAPFSHSAALFGYLRSGSTSAAVGALEKRLHRKLSGHPAFKGRAHRISTHKRKTGDVGAKKTVFDCHHLIGAI